MFPKYLRNEAMSTDRLSFGHFKTVSLLILKVLASFDLAISGLKNRNSNISAMVTNQRQWEPEIQSKGLQSPQPSPKTLKVLKKSYFYSWGNFCSFFDVASLSKYFEEI